MFENENNNQPNGFEPPQPPHQPNEFETPQPLHQPQEFDPTQHQPHQLHQSPYGAPHEMHQPMQDPGYTQHINAVQTSFDKAIKQVRDATGAAVFIATINILLGAAMTFFAADFFGDILDGMVDPTLGFIYIIPGLVYLLLSIGIFYRSRICALLAMIAFGADTYYLIANIGFDGFNIGTIVMRGALFISFILGIAACFKYHSLRNKHRYSEDHNINEIIRNSKAKPKVAAIIAYIIIAGIGIAALVQVATSGAFASGRGFDRWVEHRFVNVTVMIPSADIEETVNQIDFIPGEVQAAMSDARAVAVFLVAYVGIDGHVEGTDFTLTQLLEITQEELEEAILESTMEDMGLRHGAITRGTMAGTRFHEVSGTYDGHPFVYRAFTFDGDIYVLGILVEREQDMDLIDSFFDSVVMGY